MPASGDIINAAAKERRSIAGGRNMTDSSWEVLHEGNAFTICRSTVGSLWVITVDQRAVSNRIGVKIDEDQFGQIEASGYDEQTIFEIIKPLGFVEL